MKLSLHYSNPQKEKGSLAEGNAAVVWELCDLSRAYPLRRSDFRRPPPITKMKYMVEVKLELKVQE